MTIANMAYGKESKVNKLMLGFERVMVSNALATIAA